MATHALPQLIALTPGDLDAARASRWLSTARALFAAGLRGLMLREHALSDAQFHAWALELRRAWPREDGGWLCVHDRPHLAESIGADAVHLGGASLAAEQVRPWIPRAIALGLSTHAGDDPRAWRAADYVVHGPVLRTIKRGAREPIGWRAFAASVSSSPVPVFALGGLKPMDAGEALRHGAAGIAVLSGIAGAEDPARAAREYLEHWTRAAPS